MKSKEKTAMKRIPCDCGKGYFIARYLSKGTQVISLREIIGKNCENCGKEEISEIPTEKLEAETISLFE